MQSSIYKNLAILLFPQLQNPNVHIFLHTPAFFTPFGSVFAAYPDVCLSKQFAAHKLFEVTKAEPRRSLLRSFKTTTHIFFANRKLSYNKLIIKHLNCKQALPTPAIFGSLSEKADALIHDRQSPHKCQGERILGRTSIIKPATILVIGSPAEASLRSFDLPINTTKHFLTPTGNNLTIN